MRLRWILAILLIVAAAAGYFYMHRTTPANQTVAQRAAAVSDADEPAGDSADQPMMDAEELNPESAEADVLE